MRGPPSNPPTASTPRHRPWPQHSRPDRPGPAPERFGSPRRLTPEDQGQPDALPVGGADEKAGTLAVGQHALLHQEALQAERVLDGAPRVLRADVAVVPRLPVVTRLGVAARGVGEDEAVLVGVLLEPAGGRRPPEAPYDLVADGGVGEVHRGPQLVLAVPRRGAGPVRALAEDADEPGVRGALVLVGPVAGGHRQLRAGRRGGGHEALEVLRRLAPEQSVLAENGDPEALQGDEVVRRVVRGKGVLPVDQDLRVVASIDIRVLRRLRNLRGRYLLRGGRGHGGDRLGV